jgi:hypothetical protein
MKADPQLREVLRHAFVMAFDPELYRSGVLMEVLEITGRLSYGDLRLLHVIVSQSHLSHVEAATPDSAGMSSIKSSLRDCELGEHHVAKLTGERLIVGTKKVNIPSSSGTVITERYVPSGMGRLVSRFVHEGILAQDVGADS